MDTERLRKNFSQVAGQADELILYFYSDLFLRAPEARAMFPVTMSAQRDRLLGALASVISRVDDLDALIPDLRELGRGHRKFGAVPAHYDLVGASLLAALERFSGPEWTPELAADWAEAYALVAGVMQEAAAEDACLNPPWRDARVVSHERRGLDTAVFRAEVQPPLEYVPGQSVPAWCAAVPRTWRFLTPANAPRDDGTADFHVRAVDGGLFSSYLVRRAAAGTVLRLGAPAGTLVLDENSGRDIVMIGGSTGLAPLLAMTGQLAARPDPPQVHVFSGARQVQDLYARPELDGLAARYPWLTVTYAVSAGPDPGPFEPGTAAEAAARYGNWEDRDAYVCGSPGMVAATCAALAGQGVPAGQVHVEELQARRLGHDG